MTNNQLPIIILVDERDDITHTAEWPQCKDVTCPCHDGDDLWQDAQEDVPPTETQLDEQERIMSRPDVPVVANDVLVADLDGYTARLVEIAADKTLDYPTIRAGVVVYCAIIALWVYTEDAALKAALDRLMNAFTLVK